MLSILYGQEVWVLAEEGAEWVTAEDGMIVEPGCSVKTGDDSCALITFFDGSTVELDPNSEVLIEVIESDGDRATIGLYQKLGRTWHRVEKMVDPSSRYEVNTTAAVGAVRGTLVDVETDGTGKTTFRAFEGVINVLALGKLQAVAAGMQTSVAPGEEPESASDIPPPASRLEFSLESHAYMRVVDPWGRSVGLVPPGLVANQIPRAINRGSLTAPQVITIPNPSAGQYVIVFSGEKNGESTLTVKGFVGSTSVFEGQQANIPVNTGKKMLAKLDVTVDAEGLFTGAVLHDIEPLTGVGPGKVIKQQKAVQKTDQPAEPQANFTVHASPHSSDVSFVNQSTGDIDSHSWDFGDGQVSSDVSPTHSYASPGTYTASLTVTGPGGKDIKTRDIRIRD